MPAPTSAKPPPRPPRRFPFELWLLVFCDLADTFTTRELLEHRLVCKQFAQVISSEEVSYRAVIAANHCILGNNKGRLPRQAELPVSWWAFLLDQVRLDRIWISDAALPWEVGWNQRHAHPSTQNGENAVDPGYEIVLLTHDAQHTTLQEGKHDQLLYLDSVFTDVDSSSGQGLVGYIAFRKIDSGESHCDYYIVVHVVGYPNLAQVASHTLRHPDLLSEPGLSAGLPIPAINDIRPFGGLDIALRHVDQQQQAYLLVCGEPNGQGLLLLRSFGDNDPQETGKTVAMFPFKGSVKSSHATAVDNGKHIRFIFTDHSTPSTHIHILDRVTLAPVAHRVIPCASFSTSAQISDLLLLRSTSGHVTLWNAESGNLVDRISATPSTQDEPQFSILRPIYRPGLLRESPASRPSANQAPMHLQPEWIQVLSAHDADIDPQVAQMFANGDGWCGWSTLSLERLPPELPSTGLAHVPFPDVVPSQISRRRPIWDGLPTGPSYVSGQVAGHLWIGLQNDGSVTALDLRRSKVDDPCQWLLFEMSQSFVSQAKEVGRQAVTAGTHPLRTFSLTGARARELAKPPPTRTPAELAIDYGFVLDKPYEFEISDSSSSTTNELNAAPQSGDGSPHSDHDSVAGSQDDEPWWDHTSDQEDHGHDAWSDSFNRERSLRKSEMSSASGGQLVFLGERGDAFAVHNSGMHIAILRRSK